MGWNSWNHFGPGVDETLIRETALAMVDSGMRDAGYRYVVIDDGWEARARTADGDLVPDADRFPSGMKALADYVHSLGLRLGIYTDAGAATCQGFPGSFGNEVRDAQRFAEWGIDYVKVDWCHTEGLKAPAAYQTWSRALTRCDRPIVLSICEWGRSRPWEWAGAVGHLWRTAPDIQDTWASLMATLDRQVDLHPFAGPGHWNDPDMLEVGNGGMTVAEYRAHFGLWCALAAPLMAGNDVRGMNDEVREILTAADVIAVDQDPLGAQARRVRSASGMEVWVKRLAPPDAFAVALLNRTDEPREIGVEWSDLGWPSSADALVRDLWGREDREARAGYVTTVGAHDAAVLRLSRLS
jgi:alpha-galactosidase